MNELVKHLTEPFLVNDELEVLPTEKEIIEFIQTEDFKRVMVSEQTNTANVGAVLAVDDGPNYHYARHEIYKRVSKERAEKIGWTVINYVLSGGKDGENPNPPIYPNGPVRSVSFFPAGIAGIKTPTNQDDLVGSAAWNKWFTHVTRKASMAGYALVKTRDERIRAAKEKKQTGVQSRADIKAEKDKKHGGLAEQVDRPLHTYNLALESTGFADDIKKKYRISEDDGPDQIRYKVTNMRDFKDHRVLFEGEIDDSDRGVVKHLVEFTMEELGINERPPIKLTDEREDISTTAYYRPDTHEIKIYIKGRALADYLRSIVHEMIHHKQNEDGRLDATAGDGSKWAIDETDPLETEAHALAGDIITKFKKLSEKNIYLNEEIKIDVNVGDTILTGKFKNKKTVVKSIGKDEHGMPTINGRKVVTFRIPKDEKDDLTEVLRESPDGVYVTDGSGHAKIEHSDAVTFGFYKNKFYWSTNEEMSNILNSRVKSTHQNLYKKYPDELDKTINRTKLKRHGRLWTKKKIISFWDQPSPSELKSVLKRIESELDIRILSDRRWRIEVDANPNEVYNDLVPIDQYVGSKSFRDLGTDHGKSPMLKKRKSVPSNMGSNKSRDKYWMRECDGLTEDVTKNALASIERFADRVLAPIDVEFTRHFFDRVNDPRNKKPISVAELVSFFKRLAKDKPKLVDFLKRYKELVATDKRTDINIPFVNKVNSLLAKTIMRKPGFKTPDAKLTINEEWL